MKSAIFFERDGVLNHVRALARQQITPQTVENFHVNDEAFAPLARLKSAGYLLLAVTNQPGLSTGALSRRELDRMHAVLRNQLPLNDIFTGG